MSQNTKIFSLVLAVILLSAAATIYFSKAPSNGEQTAQTYTVGVSTQDDMAIAEAYKVYAQEKRAGINFSKGPCLTNDLMPDWVADTVHNPRISIDDQPQNQCQAYLEGRAHHFVELDVTGKLVRVY